MGVWRNWVSSRSVFGGGGLAAAFRGGDYWGGGANTVYESMMKEKWAREEQERDERIKRQLHEEWGDDYDY